MSTYKTLLHTKLIDRNMKIRSLYHLKSHDMHKSIINYTIKVLNGNEFQTNSTKVLNNLRKANEKYLNSDINTIPAVNQKYIGAYILLNDIVNNTNAVYAL